jgi:pilus assembly protein Flp/PilA
MNSLKKFVHDESGAAAVEYGMLVALIAAVVVTTVALLGTDIKSALERITTALAGAPKT